MIFDLKIRFASITTRFRKEDVKLHRENENKLKILGKMNSFAVVVYALLLMSSFYSNKYILSTLGFQVTLLCICEKL